MLMMKNEIKPQTKLSAAEHLLLWSKRCPYPLMISRANDPAVTPSGKFYKAPFARFSVWLFDTKAARSAFTLQHGGTPIEDLRLFVVEKGLR